MGWRGVYLALAVVRLFFALSSSYIHPDEHFQGPEVVAGLCLTSIRRLHSTTDTPQATSLAGTLQEHGSLRPQILSVVVLRYGSPSRFQCDC